MVSNRKLTDNGGVYNVDVVIVISPLGFSTSQSYVFFFSSNFCLCSFVVVVYGRFNVKEAWGLECMGLKVILEMVGSCNGFCKSTTL